MDGKQLKNSILQWAIQGKLVPQNPKDEPASVLLDKICNEKRKLAEKGKIKKKDLVHEPIAEDDIPFELPANWEWCRLEDIVWHLSDGTHKTPKYAESGIPFVSVKNMSSGRLSFTNTKFISKEESDILNQRCNPEKGDLLLSKVGTTGIPVIVDVDFQFSLFVSLALIKFFPNLIDSSFLVYSIYSPLVQTQVKEHTRGVGNKNWVLNDIAKTIMAIPPLAEQKRIVAKLEQVLPLAEEYGAAQEQLDKLNKELPEALKKSILQEAIQGKLVPQNPKDEPASVLLAKIRKEKEALVKQGLLKKSALEEIPIDEDEKLFDIPESWEWCNFSMIAETSLGKTKSPHKDKGKPLKYLCSINVYWNEIRLNTVKEMPFSEQEKVKYAVRKGDLLICEGGECGRAAIWDKDEETLYQNALHRVRFYKGIDARYFMHCLFFYKNTNLLDEHIKGETIKHLVQNELDSIVFPLPPLAEQKRIVAKLEQLFKVL